MQEMSKRTKTVFAALVCMATTCACHRSHDADASDGGTSQSSSTDVGVPECDAYLSKYKRCIEEKVPSDHKKAFEDALVRTRTTWKTLADNPGARPGLPQACSLAMQTAETTLKQYACSW